MPNAIDKLNKINSMLDFIEKMPGDILQYVDWDNVNKERQKLIIEFMKQNGLYKYI